MAVTNFFDDDKYPNIDGVSNIAKPDPFLTQTKKKNDDLAEWIKEDLSYLKKKNAKHQAQYRQHLRAYKSDFFGKEKIQSDNLFANRNTGPVTKKTPVTWTNVLYESIENRVSFMNRQKPSIDILPVHDEFKDKNSAKAVKLLWNHIFYINDIDFLLQQVHRTKYIGGEGYILPLFDPNKGDFKPEFIKADKQNQLDELGNPIKSKKIDKQDPTSGSRYGEVCFKVYGPDQILLQEKKKYNETEYGYILEAKHKAELIDMFPQFKNRIEQISSDTSADILEFVTMYHKRTKHYPKGRKVCYIEDLILDDIAAEEDHGELPWVRVSDIDMPDTNRGISRLIHALPIQNAHNNLTTAIMKSVYMTAVPKYFVQKNSVKIDHMSGTWVQYQGAPPILAQPRSVDSGLLNLRNSKAQEIGQMMSVHGVSRGEPPAGVTANVALQFLDQQELERNNGDITKHNNLIVELAKKAIAIAGQNYGNDERMLRVLGSENKFALKYFDRAHLGKDYDIRISKTSAVAETPAGKRQRIFDTLQYARELLPAERWVELLDLGNHEKMITIATAAITAAEAEIEDIMSGVNVAPPEVYEDIIAKLRVYYKAVQQRSYKEEVPVEIKARMEVQIEALEFLANEQQMRNPLFAAKLAQLELYPIFYKSASQPNSREQATASVQGAANRGEPTSESIPATEQENPEV